MKLVSRRGLNFKINQNDTGSVPDRVKNFHEPPTSLKELTLDDLERNTKKIKFNI